MTTVSIRDTKLAKAEGRIKTGLAIVAKSDDDAVRGWLMYGEGCVDVRATMSDEWFGQWLVANGYDRLPNGKPVDAHSRAAAIWAASEPDEYAAAKMMFPTKRTLRGIHHCWLNREKPKEPKREEPVRQETKPEAPRQEEPRKEEPKREEPKRDEPRREEPRREEPRRTESKPDNVHQFKAEPKPEKLTAVQVEAELTSLCMHLERSSALLKRYHDQGGTDDEAVRRARQRMIKLMQATLGV